MTPLTYHNPELAETRPGTEVYLKYGVGPVPEPLANKKVFLFDIDNCLYKRSTRIHDMMQDKIHEYFKQELHLNDADANSLHLNYYKTYGLALEGLVRNHRVDALEYNRRVDDALDLKAVLRYSPELRDMLVRVREQGDFDCFWLITNAYKNHALRVISFLGLGDLFDGLTFCDYSASPIVCKPMTAFYHGCFASLGIDPSDSATLVKMHFVDDSEINVKAALDLGMGHIFHYVEMDDEHAALKNKPDYATYYGAGKIRLIRSIQELEAVCGNDSAQE